MSERHCSYAPREGATPATFSQAAAGDSQSPGSAKILEFADRRLKQIYPFVGDLPVCTLLIGHSSGSPLADLAKTLGVRQVADVMTRIRRVHGLGEEVLPWVHRLAPVLIGGPSTGRDVALAPVDAFSRAFCMMYEPFEDAELRETAAKEWTATLRDARRADLTAFRVLLREFEDGPFPEHRTRVIETAHRALDSVEPLTTALWAEALAHSGQDLRDYRITRNDFDVLKSRYLDIFELAFHSVVFMARVANIARRGCAGRHANGYRASLCQALEYSRTLEREYWLIDFPVAARLYGRLKRTTRNDISHGRLRYDHESGEMVYRHGCRESYLSFLIDYLQAVRLSHYLVDIQVGLLRVGGELARRRGIYLASDMGQSVGSGAIAAPRVSVRQTGDHDWL